MKMSIFEKKALYSFGCPNYHATVDRLHLIAALAPDYETKKLLSIWQSSSPWTAPSIGISAFSALSDKKWRTITMPN